METFGQIDGKYFEEKIFCIGSHDGEDFDRIALELNEFQRMNNPVYRRYLQYLGRDRRAASMEDIVYMPVGFFKDYEIKTTDFVENVVFTSSGTTGKSTSRHFVKDVELYYKNLLKCFEQFYGAPSGYTVLALLPAYLERTGSSLVTMAEKLIESSGKDGGFYLYDFEALSQRLRSLLGNGEKVLLIGVTFALLDFAERYAGDYGDGLMVMETGGMKGRRKELVRDEVHEILCGRLNISAVHSEYGMTEMLSQAYSDGHGIYRPSATMRVIVREQNDPFKYVPDGAAGGINVIDLANIYSCAFLEIGDIGVRYADGSFKVLGRFDDASVRGCNLLYTA